MDLLRTAEAGVVLKDKANLAGLAGDVCQTNVATDLNYTTKLTFRLSLADHLECVVVAS